MRIEPTKFDKVDPFKDLDPLQKKMRRIAIGVSFAGVFVWFFKVVFGIF